MAIYYIDFENVHIGGLKGAETLDSDDTVLVYCRDKDVSVIREEFKKINVKAYIKCCVVTGTTKNALDFELISDLFIENCEEIRYIISHDKGYEAAVVRGLKKGILCFRIEDFTDAGFLRNLDFYKTSCREIIIHTI